MRIKKLKNGSGKLTKEKSRIIAHIIGDGCAYVTKHNYNIKYEVSDTELLESFEKDMVKVYGLKLSHGFKQSGKTDKLIPFVRLRSKLVYEDLLGYSTYFSRDWRIKKPLLNASKNIKREFIKAFCDDEGSVFKQGKVGIIRIYSINLNGLNQIRSMLNEFNIESKISSGYGLKRNVFAILIKDLSKFNKRIGFNLQRKQKKLNQLID